MLVGWMASIHNIFKVGPSSGEEELLLLIAFTFSNLGGETSVSIYPHFLYFYCSSLQAQVNPITVGCIFHRLAGNV